MGRMEAVGIDSTEKFFDTSVIETYMLVKDAYPDLVSLNLLYTLQSAYMDINWNNLPPNIKEDLISQISGKE